MELKVDYMAEKLARKKALIQNMKDEKIVLMQEIKHLQKMLQDRDARDRKLLIVGFLFVVMLFVFSFMSKNERRQLYLA